MALSSKEMVRMFRALSDATRLEIVQLISQSPRNVTELTALVGVSQPKVSRHLKILRDAGLLNDVRRGKWVWYEMADAAGEGTQGAIAAAMSAFFGGGAPMTPARPAGVAVQVGPARHTPARRRARGPATARARKSAARPATKPAPKEAPPARPVAPRTPAKDLDDFLL